MGCQKTYFQQFKLGVLALLLLNFSSAILAGEKENRIINKAIEAYGGDKLTQLQSVKLTDNINQYSPSLSDHSAQGAMIMTLSKAQIELTVDLINKHKVFKRVTSKLIGGHGSDIPTVAHRIFAEGKGYVVDHALQQYQVAKYINYKNVDYGNGQQLDPLIIRQLSKDRHNSQWTDTAYIQGQAHDVLNVNGGTKHEYTLYLNQKSGYLTRMLKKQGQQIRNYDFLQHRQTQGITWGKELFISTAKQPLYHSDSRKIEINSAQKHEFNIPSGYKMQSKKQFFDISQLTIRKIAKDVYFVGQDWGYTLFIDAGDHYISAGAWGYEKHSQAWQQGLDLLRKTTGHNKPVAQHIVSHHHYDHMSGLRDIVKQGANLVIHPTDIISVKEHLQQPLADNRFVPKAETSYLADGKVMLIDVPNSHASHNLVLYLPDHKLLFTEDMFGSGYQVALESPTGWPNADIYHRLDILTNKINQLNLEVEQYVSSHHGRILSQTDIDKALKLNRPTKDELIKRLFADITDLN